MRPFPGSKKGIPIEHTEQVEHHRWTPPGPQSRGLAPLDGPTRALLHQLRWRKAPPQRGRRWLALGIVLALHVLFAWLTWYEMQGRRGEPFAGHARNGALLVRLIPATPTSPAGAPPPEVVLPAAPKVTPPRPQAAPKPPPVREPPAKDAMTVSLPATAATAAPAPASSVRLYSDTGQPLLPAASSAPAPATPGYVQRGPQGDGKLMQHSSPVTYQPTRFDKDWKEGGGSAIDDALKRAVDKTTVQHTFHLAPGVRIHCGISLAALAGGCGGDPPPQPTSKSRDMRLNMAPASTLAPGTPAPKPPSEDECIAIYRADKPLPQGCPVDTPTRAVDQEMRERAAHGGG
ncbi:hypothetical protein [Dyella sedimenti]|uniref:hypothetical protein n=1 Tax=Dyella sedimenti TaxID=2919947 RepID=UPI001FAA73AE